MTPFPHLAAAASLLSRYGLQLGPDPIQREQAHRHRCEACGCEIPPGKAGRKCKDCRDGRIKTEFPGRESPIIADIRAALNAIQKRAEKPPTAATVIVPAWLIEKLQQQHGDQWESFLREHLGDATMFTTPDSEKVAQ